MVIFVTMITVGLELTLDDLSRAWHDPRHAIIALVAQTLILPLIAVGLIRFLQLPPAVAGGLILTASAPQAISSNYVCLLGRGDLALSATLTAVSNALSVFTMPMGAALAFALLEQADRSLVLPVGAIMQQIAASLLLPLAAGMLLRHYAAERVQRSRTRWKGLSLVLVLAMLVVLVAHEAHALQRSLALIIPAAMLFTVLSAAVGLVVGRAFAFERKDSITLMIAFPSRSLSIATLVAVNALSRFEFLSFALVFFVVQTSLLLSATIFLRPARV